MLLFLFCVFFAEAVRISGLLGLRISLRPDKYINIYGWMDGCMYRWIDRLMDGWMD